MSTSITNLNQIGFLAFTDQIDFLYSELKTRFNFTLKPSASYADLVLFQKDDYHYDAPYWAKCVLEEPFILKFDSISEAANQLKQIMRNWAGYFFTCFRRGSLIQEKLPYINLKEKKFPFTIPNSPMGFFTLLDEHTILASAKTSSPLPLGNITFIEDHENPPSRAYLKIQESLTMANLFFNVPFPQKEQNCFEAGACPGGWTWVLKELGANIFAVDRAELAKELMQSPQVKFLKHDAFTIKPEEVGPVDWVFSDVICYPERLLEWCKMWLESGLTKNMICTIKMQGQIDWALIKQFSDIPNSKIIHLNYNKHELTWINCKK